MRIIAIFICCFICLQFTWKDRMHTKVLTNQNLKTIKPSYAGNPMRGNKFINYQDVALPNFTKVMKWRFSKNPQRIEKKQDTWLPTVVKNNSMFTGQQNKLVWLGHASFLLTLNGKNILIDPVLNDIPFVKRLVGIPFDRDSIKHINYILLSHAHFDHCDKKSLHTIIQQNPQVKVFGPLKSTALLKSFDKRFYVQEAGWYQQFKLDDDAIEIYYMPAFHWYKRGLSDDNEMLWGSIIIKYNGTTIYFMGDSGYNTHFKEIASFFPNIDYCLMGVGAYQPAYMMKTSHMNPEEAVDAFHDLGGKTFIPMHYGTYDLADEPIGEPLRKLKDMENNKTIKGKLLTPQIGQTIGLP
jgi:L-ascorbate metabolism protein UlaG (beta-lactamase superfamily)